MLSNHATSSSFAIAGLPRSAVCKFLITYTSSSDCFPPLFNSRLVTLTASKGTCPGPSNSLVASLRAGTFLKKSPQIMSAGQSHFVCAGELPHLWHWLLFILLECDMCDFSLGLFPFWVLPKLCFPLYTLKTELASAPQCLMHFTVLLAVVSPLQLLFPRSAQDPAPYAQKAVCLPTPQ